MERLSGAYKRRAQVINVMIALLLCGALNIDSISLINTISADPGLRAVLSTAALEKARSPTTGAVPDTTGNPLGNLAEQFNCLREDPSFSRLPLGWSYDLSPSQAAATSVGKPAHL